MRAFLLATLTPDPSAPRSRVVELGCGGSRWLPYFAGLGFDVAGIDYSASGCHAAEALLRRAGVHAEVVYGDLFSPPQHMCGSFDVVFSAGVAEHFADTSAAISAFARFLRPGGRMITLVPNLGGATGAVQRRVNRPVYDMHVVLDKETLARAHRDASLEVIESMYLLPVNFGVCNLVGVEEKTPSWWFKRAVLASLVGLSYGTWWLDDHGVRLKPNRYTSPYVVCVADMRAA